MAANKKKREVQFALNDDDLKAFGHYRIMYTDQGHSLVRRQRLTYLLSGICLAALVTVFHLDKAFSIFMYIVSAVLIVAGIFFAEKLVIRQQDKAIDSTQSDVERVHPAQNRILFEEDKFTTSTGDDVQTFGYNEIKLVDLTEAAIYVWMSDTMIMPVPLHAFSGMAEMKELCKWLREKAGL